MKEEDLTISDNTLMEFQSMITKDKIDQLFEETQKYSDKIKCKEPLKRINKTIFLSFFKKIFSSKKDFINLYDLIFEKFKERKCIFSKLNNNNSNTKPKQALYFLTQVNTTGKIEIYILQIFLASVMKIKFKDKLEIMFTIVDSDLDGLINEKEIKKLIYTLHLMFAEESAEFNCESDLIKQSLSYIKARKAFKELMYGKGELYKTIETHKYITFEQFYDSVVKIENYIYNIIPTFIEIKKYLLSKNKEIKYKISDNDKTNFVDTSYELINYNNRKKYNATKLFKNCFDPEKKIPPKKRNFVEETKIFLEKQNLSNILNQRNNSKLNNSDLNSTYSKIFSVRKIKLNKADFLLISNKKENKIIPYTERKTSNNSFESKNNNTNLIKKRLLNKTNIENSKQNLFSSNISKIEDASNSLNESSIANIINGKTNNKSNDIQSKLIGKKLRYRKSKSTNSINIYKKIDNPKMIVNKQGDYYKFNNVVFPPCVLETKKKSKKLENNKKDGKKLFKKIQRCSSSKNINHELKLDSEINNEINSILDQYQNAYKFYGMEIIRDLNKKIKIIKDKHPLGKFYNNNIGFDYFKFKKNK